MEEVKGGGRGGRLSPDPDFMTSVSQSGWKRRKRRWDRIDRQGYGKASRGRRYLNMLLINTTLSLLDYKSPPLFSTDPLAQSLTQSIILPRPRPARRRRQRVKIYTLTHVPTRNICIAEASNRSEDLPRPRLSGCAGYRAGEPSSR